MLVLASSQHRFAIDGKRSTKVVGSRGVRSNHDVPKSPLIALKLIPVDSSSHRRWVRVSRRGNQQRVAIQRERCPEIAIWPIHREFLSLHPRLTIEAKHARLAWIGCTHDCGVALQRPG